MANRYFVGTSTDTNSWGATSSWSATPNGTPGASVPTASDDVFITNRTLPKLIATGTITAITPGSSYTMTINSTTHTGQWGLVRHQPTGIDEIGMNVGGVNITGPGQSVTFTITGMGDWGVGNTVTLTGTVGLYIITSQNCRNFTVEPGVDINCRDFDVNININGNMDVQDGAVLYGARWNFTGSATGYTSITIKQGPGVLRGMTIAKTTTTILQNLNITMLTGQYGFTHTSGTLNLNGYILTTSTFNSTSTSTRTLNMANQDIIVAGVFTASSTSLNFSGASGLTISNAARFVIKRSNNINLQNVTTAPAAVDVYLSPGVGCTFSSSSTCRSLTLDGATIECGGASTTLRLRIYGGELVVNQNDTATDVAATSNTSMAVSSTGSKTFNVGGGRGFAATQEVEFSPIGNSSVYIRGTVSSYNTTTGDLVITTTSSNGSGTFNSWNVYTLINALATGSKNFILPTGLTYQTGLYLRIYHPTNSDIWMLGKITTYNKITGQTVFSVIVVGRGSSESEFSYSSWLVKTTSYKANVEIATPTAGTYTYYQPHEFGIVTVGSTVGTSVTSGTVWNIDCCRCDDLWLGTSSTAFRNVTFNLNDVEISMSSQTGRILCNQSASTGQYAIHNFNYVRAYRGIGSGSVDSGGQISLSTNSLSTWNFNDVNITGTISFAAGSMYLYNTITCGGLYINSVSSQRYIYFQGHNIIIQDQYGDQPSVLIVRDSSNTINTDLNTHQSSFIIIGDSYRAPLINSTTTTKSLRFAENANIIGIRVISREFNKDRYDVGQISNAGSGYNPLTGALTITAGEVIGDTIIPTTSIGWLSVIDTETGTYAASRSFRISSSNTHLGPVTGPVKSIEFGDNCGPMAHYDVSNIGGVVNGTRDIVLTEGDASFYGTVAINRLGLRAAHVINNYSFYYPWDKSTILKNSEYFYRLGDSSGSAGTGTLSITAPALYVDIGRNAGYTTYDLDVNIGATLSTQGSNKTVNFLYVKSDYNDTENNIEIKSTAVTSTYNFYDVNLYNGFKFFSGGHTFNIMQDIKVGLFFDNRLSTSALTINFNGNYIVMAGKLGKSRSNYYIQYALTSDSSTTSLYTGGIRTTNEPYVLPIKVTGTSTTTHNSTLGSKIFVTQSGLGIAVNDGVIITSSNEIVLKGTVTAYSGTNLTVNVTYNGNSNSVLSGSNWTIERGLFIRASAISQSIRIPAGLEFTDTSTNRLLIRFNKDNYMVAAVTSHVRNVPSNSTFRSAIFIGNTNLNGQITSIKIFYGGTSSYVVGDTLNLYISERPTQNATVTVTSIDKNGGITGIDTTGLSTGIGYTPNLTDALIYSNRPGDYATLSFQTSFSGDYKGTAETIFTDPRISYIGSISQSASTSVANSIRVDHYGYNTYITGKIRELIINEGSGVPISSSDSYVHLTGDVILLSNNVDIRGIQLMLSHDTPYHLNTWDHYISSGEYFDRIDVSGSYYTPLVAYFSCAANYMRPSKTSSGIASLENRLNLYYYQVRLFEQYTPGQASYSVNHVYELTVIKEDKIGANTSSSGIIVNGGTVHNFYGPITTNRNINFGATTVNLFSDITVAGLKLDSAVASTSTLNFQGNWVNVKGSGTLMAPLVDYATGGNYVRTDTGTSGLGGGIRILGESKNVQISLTVQSSTSLNLATGSKTFTVPTGLDTNIVIANNNISITDSAGLGLLAIATITSYNSGTGALVVTINSTNNSVDTRSDWIITFGLALTTGTKTLFVGAGQHYAATTAVGLFNNPRQFMTGTITSYTVATGLLVVNITQVNGSGLLTDWDIYLSGDFNFNTNITGTAVRIEPNSRINVDYASPSGQIYGTVRNLTIQPFCGPDRGTQNILFYGDLILTELGPKNLAYINLSLGQEAGGFQLNYWDDWILYGNRFGAISFNSNYGLNIPSGSVIDFTINAALTSFTPLSGTSTIFRNYYYQNVDVYSTINPANTYANHYFYNITGPIYSTSAINQLAFTSSSTSKAYIYDANIGHGFSFSGSGEIYIYNNINVGSLTCSSASSGLQVFTNKFITVNDRSTIQGSISLTNIGTNGLINWNFNPTRLPLTVSFTGNPIISYSAYKFGWSSAYFNSLTGLTDALIITNSVLVKGSSNWTIEGWFKADVVGYNQVLFDYKIIGNSSDLTVYIDTNNQVRVNVNNTDVIFSEIVLNTIDWYHIALVKSSNQTKLYIQGTNRGTTYSDSNNYTSNTLTIGTGWNGYIDEVRISNISRYTNEFTPSTSEFLNDTSTRLLLHFNNSNNSQIFTDDSGLSGGIINKATGTIALGNGTTNATYVNDPNYVPNLIMSVPSVSTFGSGAPAAVSGKVNNLIFDNAPPGTASGTIQVVGNVTGSVQGSLTSLNLSFTTPNITNFFTATNNSICSKSSTSIVVGTGSKTFILDPTYFTKNYGALQNIYITNIGSPGVVLTGTVTSYSALTGTLVTNITSVVGTGTLSNWSIQTDPTGTTSTTTLTSDIGIKTLTVATGLTYIPGTDIDLIDLTNANGVVMTGSIISYNFTTGILIVNITISSSLVSQTSSMWAVLPDRFYFNSLTVNGSGTQLMVNHGLDCNTFAMTLGTCNFYNSSFVRAINATTAFNHNGGTVIIQPNVTLGAQSYLRTGTSATSLVLDGNLEFPTSTNVNTRFSVPDGTNYTVTGNGWVIYRAAGAFNYGGTTPGNINTTTGSNTFNLKLLQVLGTSQLFSLRAVKNFTNHETITDTIGRWAANTAAFNLPVFGDFSVYSPASPTGTITNNMKLLSPYISGTDASITHNWGTDNFGLGYTGVSMQWNNIRMNSSGKLRIIHNCNTSGIFYHNAGTVETYTDNLLCNSYSFAETGGVTGTRAIQFSGDSKYINPALGWNFADISFLTCGGDYYNTNLTTFGHIRITAGATVTSGSTNRNTTPPNYKITSTTPKLVTPFYANLLDFTSSNLNTNTDINIFGGVNLSNQSGINPEWPAGTNINLSQDTIITTTGDRDAPGITILDPGVGNQRSVKLDNSQNIRLSTLNIQNRVVLTTTNPSNLTNVYISGSLTVLGSWIIDNNSTWNFTGSGNVLNTDNAELIIDSGGTFYFPNPLPVTAKFGQYNYNKIVRNTTSTNVLTLIGKNTGFNTVENSINGGGSFNFTDINNNYTNINNFNIDGKLYVPVYITGKINTNSTSSITTDHAVVYNSSVNPTNIWYGGLNTLDSGGNIGWDFSTVTINQPRSGGLFLIIL